MFSCTRARAVEELARFKHVQFNQSVIGVTAESKLSDNTDPLKYMQIIYLGVNSSVPSK